jgi:hypothetical protein
MPTTNRTRADKRWLALLALLGLSAAGGACDRSHLSSYYGRSYATWFAVQHVRSTPADSETTKRALSSLDAQEAAAVSKNYRHNVGSEAQAGQGQMVMIGQNRGAGPEGYTPPPSVPAQ